MVSQPEIRVGGLLGNDICVDKTNMGKVETQEVVQFVWSIKFYTGVLGNEGTSTL